MDPETRYALKVARLTGSWRLWLACVFWVVGLRWVAARIVKSD